MWPVRSNRIVNRMIRATICSLTWCLIALSAGANSPAWTDSLSTEELLRQAQKQEHDYAWLAASELYAELAKREPERAKTWQGKQQTCRRQDRISRRYYSPHVRKNLLTL